MHLEIQIGIIIILSLLLFFIYGRMQAAEAAFEQIKIELIRDRNLGSYHEGYLAGMQKGQAVSSQDGWSDEALEYRKMMIKIVDKYLTEIELES